MRKLTPRQAEILQFIRAHIEDVGIPPTRGEITEAFGFHSVNATTDHLKALEAKGAIVLMPGVYRGILLPKDSSSRSGLPLIGRLLQAALSLPRNWSRSTARSIPPYFTLKPTFYSAFKV